jgi:hypothetical protein
VINLNALPLAGDRASLLEFLGGLTYHPVKADPRQARDGFLALGRESASAPTRGWVSGIAPGDRVMCRPVSRRE